MAVQTVTFATCTRWQRYERNMSLAFPCIHCHFPFSSPFNLFFSISALSPPSVTLFSLCSFFSTSCFLHSPAISFASITFLLLLLSISSSQPLSFHTYSLPFHVTLFLLLLLLSIFFISLPFFSSSSSQLYHFTLLILFLSMSLFSSSSSSFFCPIFSSHFSSSSSLIFSSSFCSSFS